MTRRRWEAAMFVSGLVAVALGTAKLVADDMLEARAQAAAAEGAPGELAALTSLALQVDFVACLVISAAVVALAVSVVGYWKSRISAARPASEEQKPGDDEGAIKHADRIVVLEGGRIENVGVHDELIQKDGLYKRLYEMQFRDK